MPFPPDSEDTPESQRAYFRDLARAEDEHDRDQPSAAELAEDDR